MLCSFGLLKLKYFHPKNQFQFARRVRTTVTFKRSLKVTRDKNIYIIATDFVALAELGRSILPQAAKKCMIEKNSPFFGRVSRQTQFFQRRKVLQCFQLKLQKINSKFRFSKGEKQKRVENEKRIENP